MTNPQAIPNESQVSAALERVYERVTDRFGSQVSVLEDATAPEVDKGQVCRVTMALYDEVLTLPKATASRSLRFMFAKQ